MGSYLLLHFCCMPLITVLLQKWSVCDSLSHKVVLYSTILNVQHSSKPCHGKSSSCRATFHHGGMQSGNQKGLYCLVKDVIIFDVWLLMLFFSPCDQSCITFVVPLSVWNARETTSVRPTVFSQSLTRVFLTLILPLKFADKQIMVQHMLKDVV